MPITKRLFRPKFRMLCPVNSVLQVKPQMSRGYSIMYPESLRSFDICAGSIGVCSQKSLYSWNEVAFGVADNTHKGGCLRAGRRSYRAKRNDSPTGDEIEGTVGVQGIEGGIDETRM